MATIKDVARLAGVSVTTVSIIINGKANERKIPLQTCNKVTKAMNALGYQPNLSARRLRSVDALKPVIAFYWPLDYRTNMLASFLNGIQAEIKRRNFSCELVVQTYENDNLFKDATAIIKNSYNGVIIGATSKNDLQYLETLSPQMPIVLINRDSKKYSTISADNNDIARKAANLFSLKGYSEVAIFTAEKPYLATSLRTKAFIKACAEIGLQVDEDFIIKAPNSMEGGIYAANQFVTLKNPPKVLFCDSDSMALGAIYAFNKTGIQIPQDLELIAIGMSNPEVTMYSTPPITVVAMPTEELAATAISVIIDSLSHQNGLEPIHKIIDSKILIRDSFRL